MPVAWAYLGFLCLLGLRVHVVSGSALLSSLFFFRNFDATTFGSTTWHFWSLSLEEQFYLAWPIVLLLAGARWCRWIAIVAMCACATYRLIFWSHFNQQFFNCQTQARADALLAGCLLALLLREPEFRARIEKSSAVLALPALCVLIYCVGRFTLLPPLVESVSIAVLLAASVLHPHSTFVKPLNWRWLSTLGVVSYSVYVWQELFMLIAGDQPILRRVLTLTVVFPFIALCSYRYLERPLTRVGQKLSERLNGQRATPQRRPALENKAAA
jgi:peptidoglycan/LPS O-acetylase OafA/YrhL